MDARMTSIELVLALALDGLIRSSRIVLRAGDLPLGAARCEPRRAATRSCATLGMPLSPRPALRRSLVDSTRPARSRASSLCSARASSDASRDRHSAHGGRPDRRAALEPTGRRIRSRCDCRPHLRSMAVLSATAASALRLVTAQHRTGRGADGGHRRSSAGAAMRCALHRVEHARQLRWACQRRLGVPPNQRMQRTRARWLWQPPRRRF